MNIAFDEMNLPINEINNPDFQSYLSKQAEFYINWNLDLLIKEEQDNSGEQNLNNNVIEKIKIQAVNDYLPYYQETVNDLRAVA